MTNEKGPTRRQFVFALGALAWRPPAAVRSAGPVQTEPWTATERAVLDALCEQIFPKDEYAGARELGVVAFLETTLLKAHPEWLASYRAGLQSAEKSSLELYQQGVAQISAEQQTRLVSMMEADKLPAALWTGPSASVFFAMMRDHTLQGVYSHPRYGGNRGKQAWKMIGYDDRW